MVEDSFILSKLIDSGALVGLKPNVIKHLGMNMTSYTDTAKSTKLIIRGRSILNTNWNLVDWAKYGQYGAKDAFVTYLLILKLLPIIEVVGKSNRAIIPSADVLSCYRNIDKSLQVLRIDCRI